MTSAGGIHRLDNVVIGPSLEFRHREHIEDVGGGRGRGGIRLHSCMTAACMGHCRPMPDFNRGYQKLWLPNRRVIQAGLHYYNRTM
jgi:hypothetical protein